VWDSTVEHFISSKSGALTLGSIDAKVPVLGSMLWQSVLMTYVFCLRWRLS
jgi:hypothetical protein